MSESTEFFQQVSRELSGGRPVAVALVTRRRGSGPRQPGAKLVLDSAGRVWGTVGGGDFEFRVLERARDVLRTGRPERVALELQNEDAAAAGMMCGGWIEALVDRFLPDNRPLNRLIAKAQAALGTRQPCVLVISMTGVEPSLGTAWDLVVDGQSVSAIAYPKGLVDAWSSPPTDDHCPNFLDAPGGCLYVEWIRPPEAVYIFGAGHIGEELAPLCRRTGFWTVVLDDRPEFANRDRFPDAHEVVVLDRYAGAMARLPIDDRSYIVIVTRGHLHDREVLEQALDTRARYVGMIGSPRKRSTIFTALERAGRSADALDRVRCPVGLAIGAETPAELALSIASELVGVRRGVLPRRENT